MTTRFSIDSCCTVCNRVFLMLFIAYQYKVHRVVARCMYSWLLRVGKNYTQATKCQLPHAMKHPWNREYTLACHLHSFVKLPVSGTVQAGDCQLSLSTELRASLLRLYFSVVFAGCGRHWSGPRYRRHPRNLGAL